MDNLKLLKDDPAFTDLSNDSDQDVFNHQAVADVIMKIMADNSPPITIGLFGGWGVGKSTIMNMVKHKNQSKHKFVYFNAWTNSGESFRRQFLLKFAKDLISNEAKRNYEIERIQKLNYAKSLEEEDGLTLGELINKARTYGFIEYLKKQWNNLKVNFRVTDIGLFRVVFSLVALTISILLFVFGDSEVKKWGLVTFMLTVAGFFVPKIENVLVLKRREVFDAKLIFPEQFEGEYQTLVEKYSEDKKIIVVIDDLDRCDAENIKEILVTLKNYLNNEKCIFIVPIDDSSVVRMFKGENVNFGYEQLRKYFSISLRIPAIHQEDLIEFAKIQAKEYNIPADVIFIAALGYCTDARKMKHFLNLYKIKYALAKQRDEIGYLPNFKINEIQNQLAKLVILEYQWPEFLRYISQNPDELSNITEIAKKNTLHPKDNEFFKRINSEYENINTFWNDNCGLKEFLIRTYDIEFDNFDILSKLKSTHQESVLIQRGIDFRKNITENVPFNKEIFGDNKPNDTISEHVVEVLRNLFDPTFPLVSLKVLSISFDIVSENILTVTSHKRLFKFVVENINDKLIILKLNDKIIKSLLDNFNIVNTIQKKDIIDRIVVEIKNSNKYFKGIINIINHDNFDEIMKIDENLLETINGLLLVWYDNEISEGKTEIAEDILKIKYSNDERKKMGLVIPSNNLLLKFIKDIITTEAKEENIKFNDCLIRNITNSYNYFDFDEISIEFENVVMKMIGHIQEELAMSELTKQAFDTIYKMPDYLSNKNAIEISSLIISNFTNYSATDEQHELLKMLAFLYTNLSDDEKEKKAIMDFYNPILDNYNSKELEKQINILKKLKNYVSDRIDSFISSNLEELLKNVTIKLSKTNDELIEKALVLYDNNNFLDNAKFVSLIMSIIELKNNSIFRKWLDVIERCKSDFSEINKTEIANKLTEIIIDKTNEKEIREFNATILKNLLESINILDGQKNISKVIKAIIDDDELVLKKFVCENSVWINGRYTLNSLQVEFNEVFRYVIDKDSMSDYVDLINSIIPLFNEFDTESRNIIGDKIIADLNNHNKDISHRRLLLEISNYIPDSYQHKDELSKTLYDFKNSGDIEDLKGKAWEKYRYLIEKKIINEYEPPAENTNGNEETDEIK